MRKKIISISTFFLINVTLPVMVLAQTIDNPLKGGSDIEVIVNTILTYIMRVGGIVATFAFIYSGFLFVKARGSETELNHAKEFFKGTVIGTIVLVGATVIGEIIKVTITSLK